MNLCARLLNRLQFAANRWIIKAATSLINTIMDVSGVDPGTIMYQRYGIMKWHEYESGELWFLRECLRSILADIDEPVLLDVGANSGNYSLELVEAIPGSRCYALEPNPLVYDELVLRVSENSRVVPINYGASGRPSQSTLYVHGGHPETEHGSLYREVFTDMHKDDKPVKVSCKFDRIDRLLLTRCIPEDVIHFIKVDTEGHELEALKGAVRTIQNPNLRVIQFEFNEMNVVSRVFLKDFYDLLGDEWSFYRLDSNCLHPLGIYDSANEIFKYQNIIAINLGRLSSMTVEKLRLS